MNHGLSEVLVHDVSGRPVIYSWDGRVLEIFGHLGARTQGATATHRLHVDAMELSVEGPDRKGRHQVTVGYPELGPFINYQFDDEAIGRLRPLLDAVTAALEVRSTT